MRMSIGDAPSARTAAIRKLALDAMTCEVLRGFRDANVASVLLKGVTLQPLYGTDRARRYTDADLLVPRADLPRARAVLAGLGFALRFDPRDQPAHLPAPHAEDWRRGRDAVDLHWRLLGVGADDERAWRVLAAHTRAMHLGAEPARVLDDDASALLLALHAVHHRGSKRKPLDDLGRGLAQLDPGAWPRAAALARELDATESFSAGLRALPAGGALARELELPAARSRRVRVAAGRGPREAVGLLALLETPWRGGGKARVLRAVLAPSPEFMRTCFPLARRGRAGLALAYAVRAGRRARQLPAALAAVWRA